MKKLHFGLIFFVNKFGCLVQTFYLIGRDEKKTFWRILKIDRTDPKELNLFEDPTRYTHDEISQLKKWISRGNQEHGGLRAETTCYGIIGTSVPEHCLSFYFLIFYVSFWSYGDIMILWVQVLLDSWGLITCLWLEKRRKWARSAAMLSMG